MIDKHSKKTKLLDYLREHKIRKDWLADKISGIFNKHISKVMFSHYLHGRKSLNHLRGHLITDPGNIEIAIAEILKVPRNELF